MRVHLLDGTYELFRHFFAMPSQRNEADEEIAAVRGVVTSVLNLLSDGATHVAVATDHVIESFRNELWPGYKDGSGIDPELHAQFPLLEEAAAAMGIVVWPMREHEADDGLASGAHLAAADARVEQVVVCTPDKDLAQCVVGERVVQMDRRKNKIIGDAGVVEKFGVMPASIPDYLALVGDSADGFPGLPGWGAKSSGLILGHYGHLEAIPDDPGDWAVQVRGAARLAEALVEHRQQALLFRRLARLVVDLPLFEDVEELRWRGTTPQWPSWCQRLGAPDLERRARNLAADRDPQAAATPR